jgi:hypothetical protein
MVADREKGFVIYCIRLSGNLPLDQTKQHAHDTTNECSKQNQGLERGRLRQLSKTFKKRSLNWLTTVSRKKLWHLLICRNCCPN